MPSFLHYTCIHGALTFVLSAFHGCNSSARESLSKNLFALFSCVRRHVGHGSVSQKCDRVTLTFSYATTKTKTKRGRPLTRAVGLRASISTTPTTFAVHDFLRTKPGPNITQRKGALLHMTTFTARWTPKNIPGSNYNVPSIPSARSTLSTGDTS